MDPLDQLGSRFTGLQLQEETTAGRVYTGQDTSGTAVTIAVLVGAASDPAARHAFAEAVWRHSAGAGSGRATVAAADLHAVFPWAATRNPSGHAGAEQLLAGVADRPALPGPEPGPVGAPGLAPAAGGAGLAPAAGAAELEPVSPLPILPGRIALPRRSRLARLGGPGGPWPWLLGAAGGVLLVLLATAAIAGVQALWGGEPGPPGTGPTSGAPVGPGPAGPGGSGDPDLPQLRVAAPVSVVGPSFGPDEPAEPIGFVGWPFAFRAPPGWECFEERLDEIPEAEFYRCEPPAGAGEQLVAVLLWECPTDCTEGEQEAMLGSWLPEPEFAERLATTPTAYVETGRNRDGFYTVSLGHFAAAEPGGALRWLVGVYVESPVDTRAGVQKVLNDIVSQTTY